MRVCLCSFSSVTELRGGLNLEGSSVTRSLANAERIRFIAHRCILEDQLESILQWSILSLKIWLRFRSSSLWLAVNVLPNQPRRCFSFLWSGGLDFSQLSRNCALCLGPSSLFRVKNRPK